MPDPIKIVGCSQQPQAVRLDTSGQQELLTEWKKGQNYFN
jgi:hypothetical protein